MVDLSTRLPVEQLINSHSSDLTWGNSAAWLELQGHHDLSEDHLQRIQMLAAGRRWSNEKRKPGMELAQHGTWLPDEVRKKLAKSLVSSWGGPAAARTWVESLSDEFRAGAEAALQDKEHEIAAKSQREDLKDPRETLQVLAEPERHVSMHGLTNEWAKFSPSEVRSWAERLEFGERAAVIEVLE